MNCGRQLGMKILSETATKPERQMLDRSLEKARLQVQFNPAQYGVTPVAVDSLLVDVAFPADLLLPMVDAQTRQLRMEVASKAGHPFQQRWQQRLRAAGLKHIFIETSQTEALRGYFRQHSDIILSSDNLSLKKRATVIQEMSVLNLRDIFDAPQEEPDASAVNSAVRRTKDTVQRLVAHPQLLTRLAETLRSDYSIYTHSVNVCMLAMSFGSFLGMNQNQQQALGIGAMLHDVGMSSVPKHILEKPHELATDEMAVIHAHPRKGYQMLLHVGAVPYDSLMIILHHHEDADGGGYPAGLPAARTPLPARVVRLCDAFDAMTSQRPHHDPLSAFEAAAKIIESSDDKFGADLAPKFVRFLATDFIK